MNCMLYLENPEVPASFVQFDGPACALSRTSNYQITKPYSTCVKTVKPGDEAIVTGYTLKGWGGGRLEKLP